MNHKQKRKNFDKDDQPRKKGKFQPVKQNNDFEAEVGLLEVLKPELLDTKSIREGLVILGCITYIGKSKIGMSLPGYLYGTVEAVNISDDFTAAVEASAKDPDTEVPSIDSVVELGMVLPCKVSKIEHGVTGHMKTHISLSIKPEDINGNLKPSSLYSKMGLFVSVRSIEDHGYVLNVGNASIQGFLPKGNCDAKQDLKTGQLIPVYVEKIQFSNKKCARVTFYGLSSSHQQFPEVSLDETIKLHSILPGAKLTADVIGIQKHYAILKCFNFDACVSFFCPGYYKGMDVGDKVTGTVLYISPITHLIHLSLDDLPCPAAFSKYFQMKKLEIVNTPKFLNFFRNRAIYRLDHGKFGFINIWDLPSKQSGMATIPSSAITDIEKARIVSLHYMDNIVQLSAKSSVLAQNIILKENIKAGDIYDVVVEQHSAGGMFVHICPGVLGFVRNVHMSDAYITKPEQLYPVKSAVRCRVLYNDGEGKIYLTSKKSLLELDNKHILSSYWDARNDHFYSGVVVKVSLEYILVLFFNDVKGVVKRGHMPLHKNHAALHLAYFVGQTITCKVLHCDPKEKKLNLSHEIDQLNTNQNYVHKVPELSLDEKNIQSKKKKHAWENNYSLHQIAGESDDLGNETVYLKASTGMQDALLKPSKAVIAKVKGHQLNISLNEKKGRVHITELGCTTEGIYPLKEFSPDQRINVYIIKEFYQKRSNFLVISHRNMTAFKECTLKFPPRPCDFTVGDSLLGFVKEVHDIYATVWLSPSEFGILDYMHYSDKPKVVRKLCRNLKVGLSLHVSILDIKHDSTKDKHSHGITLTKIDYRTPEVGKNILGLVQVACPIRGLIMKLPFGYHGNVFITDLTDVYEPVQNLYRRYQKLKFLKCHVLEVDHETKYCLLSLRMSRLYQKKAAPNSFCPEITPDMIEEGNKIKGFVKNYATNSTLSVLIGRQIEGKISLHDCNNSKHCKACKKVQKVLGRYPPGSVVDVIIKGKSSQNEFILSLPELKTTESNLDALPVEEDINFDIPGPIIQLIGNPQV